MSEYKQDIFYKNTSNYSMEDICRDAHSKCYHWHVDDQPAWARRQIDMPLDDVIKFLYSHHIHFVIIHRRGYLKSDYHLEIGFCTMNRKDPNGDIFLWIDLDEKYLDYFKEKYKLELL